MFVTSDIFDLKQIAWKRGIADWKEQLVGGVGFHGTDYPGAEAVARFLITAAEICGLEGQLPRAGYWVRWGEPSEHVEPSMLGELARGALPEASGADGVYLLGPASASGGVVSGGPRVTEDRSGLVPDCPYRAFDGAFLFAVEGESLQRAQALLRLAAEVVQADYGYYFVRDALADPTSFLDAMTGRFDRSLLGRADHLEADMWNNFVRTGELWTGVWPQLRDLFAVNLLSEWHFRADLVAFGHLDEWIKSEPGRGQLTRLGDGRVLWTLTDEQLYAVRPILWDTALTRTCMPRVYRDLPYARERPDPDTGKFSAPTSAN